jgi:phospholipid/cholesterol/gamma-HCH transport system substrate-binding protein
MPRNLEFKVGLFVIATIVLIVSAAGYIAFKKDVFSRVYTFTFSAKSGEGFSEGMPLVFSGFQIGKVYNLELNEKGLVLIRIKVPERHIKWMRSDSIFILDRPLIGTPKIVVYTNDLASPVLAVTDQPEVFPVDSIDEAIHKVQPLLNKVDTILENSVMITSRLSHQESLLEMLVGDKTTVGSVNTALQQLDEVSQRADLLLARFDALAVNTNEGLFGHDGLLPLVRTILLDVIEKLRRLNAIVDDLPRITSGVADSLSNVDVLKTEIEASIDSTNRLLNDIERLVPAQKEKEIILP